MRAAPGSPSGTGLIQVSDDSHLYFDGTQTLKNATVDLGNSTIRAYLRETDAGGVGNQVLTLDANTTVDVLGYADIRSGSAPGDGIVNDGLIKISGGSVAGNLIIDTNTFVNDGTVETTNNADIAIFKSA
jgi:hypothetical protein